MTQDLSLIMVDDVEGAPARIGERVRITGASPEDGVEPEFLGRTGTVVALVFDDPRHQYPHDPLIQVCVEELGEELFFPEELDLAPAWARRRIAEFRRMVRRDLARAPSSQAAPPAGAT